MRSIAKFLAGIVVGISLAAAAAGLATFPDEVQAQRHCPTDTVVWLNLPTMIWHYKGQRWYGRTQHGAYACEKEAAVNGARGTRNGQ
jgi:hypothetical protein